MWRRNRWVFLGGVVGFAILYLALRGAPNTAPPPTKPVAPAPLRAEAPGPTGTTPSPSSRARSDSDDPLLWRTKGGHVGAVSRAKLDQATSYVAQGDRAAFEAMLASDPGVFVLETGLEVYVADSGGILGSVVKIRKKGTTAEIWTVREAIER